MEECISEKRGHALSLSAQLFVGIYPLEIPADSHLVPRTSKCLYSATRAEPPAGMHGVPLDCVHCDFAAK